MSKKRLINQTAKMYAKAPKEERISATAELTKVCIGCIVVGVFGGIGMEFSHFLIEIIPNIIIGFIVAVITPFIFIFGGFILIDMILKSIFDFSLL